MSGDRSDDSECGEWVCRPRYETSRTCQLSTVGAQAGLGGGRLEGASPERGQRTQLSTVPW